MDKYVQQNTARMEKILATSAREGLSLAAVRERQRLNGKNRLLPDNRVSVWHFLSCLVHPLSCLIMLAALLLSYAFLPLATSLTVTAIYTSFLLICFLLYVYRQREYATLDRLTLAHAKVVREGKKVLISPEDLVVGDLLMLAPGDILYTDAHLITDDCIEVFCDRGGIKETLIKHGGACFDGQEEAFNSLCAGDVVRAGQALAFVTQISTTPPKAERARSTAEKAHSKLCRMASRLALAVSFLSLLIAFFTAREGSALASSFLCAAVVLAISPASWCELLFDCVFLARNKSLKIKMHAFFSSMQAAEEVAEGNFFLLSTQSVFRSSRFVVRAFESGTGTRISENSSASTPELSLIAASLLAIHEKYSMPSYERHLIAFCKRHMKEAPTLLLNSLAFSPEYDDLSIASFRSEKDGRGFSFVGGDPELLLPYILYISEEGRTRLIDAQTKERLLSDIRRLKKNGHRLVAYAETQTRALDGVFPVLVRDMKLMGFFVLSELPDSKITDALEWIVKEKKKAFFFHDGDDPSWITSAIPLLKNAPVVDGGDPSFKDEISVFCADEDLPFCIGIHVTPLEQSQLVHMLNALGYVTVACGSSFGDHRMMCAAAACIAPPQDKKKESVGIVHAAATVYAKEHIGAEVGSVVSAEGLLRSLGVATAYFCASLLSRSVLLLIGIAFGCLLLSPISFAAFGALVDLLAFWCLCRVKTKSDDETDAKRERDKDLGLFVGCLLGAVCIGGLSVLMAYFPHLFAFSFAAFAFVSLLLMLNVGVLRFASARPSPSALSFPLISLLICAAYFLIEYISIAETSLTPSLPFWALLPTVVLYAVGKVCENVADHFIKNHTNKEKR